jgi:radical SAM superfamily enzyme YgiQ (UPF0313 family)
MHRREKIALFIPPAYDRFNPPLGTPALLSFLKAKGIDALQDDLNLRYFDYLKRNKLERVFSPEYKQEKIKKRVYYHRILRYKGAWGSSGYGFEANPGSSFAFTEMMLSSKFLHRYLADEKENLFVNFFHQQVLPNIKKHGFSLVGFSITCPSQVIASFTFGYFIKKYFPKIKIVVGGQWVSFYREELQKRNDFRKFYDYVIYFEGETPLFNLIEAIRDSRPLAKVPNLIYRDGVDWRSSDTVSDEEMDALPAPDFGGLNLKKYFDFKQKSALTFETSRGCYWNKCIFCIDLPLPKPRYREKSPDLVVRDIKNLIKKYRVKHLVISNAVFSPAQMKEIAKRILKERIKISWWAMARFDPGFDRKVLTLAKRSGCSMLGFGLESINQRVLDFIDKGTRVEVIKRIVKDSRDLKLNIYFQSIIGLPSETSEEAFETIFFLLEHAKATKTNPAAFNIYYLLRKNMVFLNPARHGIKVVQNKRLPFRFFYPFKRTLGNITNPKADKMIKFYNRILQVYSKDKTIAKQLPF